MSAGVEKIRFVSSGEIELAGLLHLPGGSCTSGVVVCHGMLSHKGSPKLTETAERLCGRGHAVLRFDFSGRGESGGDLLGLSFRRQVDECMCAMGVMRARGIERIGLVGSSMGGATAILVSSLGSVSALVTMAAIGHADRMIDRVSDKVDLEMWRQAGSAEFEGERVGWLLVEDARGIDIMAAGRKISCPWLILHGEYDEVIPVGEAFDLQKASNCRAHLEVVAGADHRFFDASHRDRVVDMTVEFLHARLS